MNFLQKLFGGAFEETIPPVVLGRYSDAFKSEDKYDAWDRALKLFEEDKYRESYRAFFDYLYDPEQDNLKFTEEDGLMRFELLQGSKRLTGTINDQIIKVEAQVAAASDLSIGLLRRMVELNFSLKYSRFAVNPEDNLVLVFDSYLLDGSPYKLYFALKEVAVNADKQDDLLLSEFESLKPIDTGHIRDIPESEKEIKYAFLQKRISETLKEVREGKLNADQYPGGIGYLLLDLVYRLDFLIKPEGNTMEAFERIHRMFFAPDGKSPGEKNLSITRELEKILNSDKSQFFKELYVTSSSFGITSPSTQEQLTSFIESEITNMDWYVENKHDIVAQAIPGYIVGYCLFNYAFPPPIYELLVLYYRIMEPGYFAELGFSPVFYDTQNNEFDKQAIGHKISLIEAKHREQYGDFKGAEEKLVFENKTDFARSYMHMLAALNVEKKK